VKAEEYPDFIEHKGGFIDQCEGLGFERHSRTACRSEQVQKLLP